MTRPKRDPGYTLRVYRDDDVVEEVSGYQSLDGAIGAGNMSARGELPGGAPTEMEVILEGTVIYRWTPNALWFPVT